MVPSADKDTEAAGSHVPQPIAPPTFWRYSSLTATATEITKQLQEIEKTSAHKSSAAAETARTSRFPEAQNTPHKHETDPHADAHAATEAGPHQLPADLLEGMTGEKGVIDCAVVEGRSGAEVTYGIDNFAFKDISP